MAQWYALRIWWLGEEIAWRVTCIAYQWLDFIRLVANSSWKQSLSCSRTTIICDVTELRQCET